MALIIYGSARSRTMRTLWLCAELGLDYEHVPYEWDAAALKSPEFLALNPAGAIPMIVDDGVVVAESMAIALHLSRRYGDAGPEPVYPQGPQAQADVLRWSLWAQGQLEPWVQQDLRLSELRAQAGAVTRAEASRSLATLERGLAGRRWLAGDHFTVGDLNVAGVLSPSRARLLPIGDHPAVADWGSPAATRARRRRRRGRATRRLDPGPSVTQARGPEVAGVSPMRVIALAAGLAFVSATPSLALTVSGTPARPTDVAQHLKPSEGSGSRLQDSYVGAGRPMTGSSFTGAPQSYGTTSFGFGPVRTTVTSGSQDLRWRDRRDTPAPLSLSPYMPRR